MTSHSRRLLAGIAVLVGLLPVAASAQSGTTITGRVSDATGTRALDGVAVSIPELRIGGYTDAGGRYSITAPASANGRTVLMTVRRIGYQPDSAQVSLTGGSVTRDISLRERVTQLTGVVITAMGQEVQKAQLGTAQQAISTEDLNVTKAQNLVQQLQGKVSGVTITSGATQGGSTNIIIRGQNTLASNNQPLFVVDGIPVSNSNRGGGLVNGYDFGNAISDLNPEDIETMTILKGPNAAALYGSRAQNGAILITTKKGLSTEGRMRMELSSFFTMDNPSRLPDFQDQYGQGARGEFEYFDGQGGGTNDGSDQSWGPKMDGRPICQFNSPGAGTSNCTPTPWVAHPDNVKDFFDQGRTSSTTLAVSGGTQRANARMSFGLDNQQGFVPNNDFQKATALLNGSLQVTSKLTTTAGLQYVRNNAKNRAGTGYLNSPLEQFFWFGRNVDVNALRDYRKGGATNNGPASREYNWNYNYHNNPFFSQYENELSDSRDRFFVQGSADYKITPWLSAFMRSGSDIFRFNIDQRFDPAFLNSTYVNPAYQGGYTFITDYRNEHNTEGRITANGNFTEHFALNAMVGGNVRREQFQTTSQFTTGLSVAGIFNPTNAAITPTLGQNLQKRHMNSVFGSASVTFNGWLTVEGTGRQDQSSTLPKGDNTYFYPSLNTSIVLTDAVTALQNRFLSLLKIRGSIAEVGNDADPYLLNTVFAGNANKFGGRPQFSLGDQLLEPNLRPEITRSNEIGLEAGFLDGRVTLDLTGYDKVTRNQIYLVPVSTATGFSQKLINAGRMQNKGFEALLSLTPVQLQNGFTWTTTANYSTNNNKVVELAPGVNRIVPGNGLFSDVRLEATKGLPFGAIWGGGFARCDQSAIDDDLCTEAQRGRRFTSGGFHFPTDTFVYLGSIQPKWTGGLSNQLSYKGVSLSVLLDFRRGGKIMSYTNYVGTYSGVLASTLKGREVDWDNPGVVAEGIDIDTGEENAERLTAEDYFQGLFGNVEPAVYDNNWTKLREVRVGVDLPQRWATRLSASAISLSFTGRNLFMWTDVPNVDPEFAYSSGNFQGIEYAFPGNTRSVGFNVRITP